MKEDWLKKWREKSEVKIKNILINKIMSKEKSENKKKIVVVKPYTLRELAALYQVGWKTFKSWIKPFTEEIGERRGRFLTIPQVKTIFEKLDYPPCFQLTEED